MTGIFLYLYHVKRLTITAFFLMLSLFYSNGRGTLALCHAQNTVTEWQQYYQMIADEDDDNDEEQMQLIYETLSEAAASPININAISREQLQNLICFSESQIDAILEYVDHYAPLLTKAELLMIPYLDTARRGILDALTYIGEAQEKQRNELDSIKFDNAVRDYKRMNDRQAQKGEVTAFTRIPLYSRKGPFLGGKLKHWIRAGYAFNRRTKIGFVGSQDAGEPFFKGRNSAGYDYYSGYIQLQRYGALKKFIAGRYRIKSGLGLILNNNYSFGKTFSVASIQSSATSLRPHYSLSDGNYLQGATATMSLSRHTETSLFISHRRIDATLTNDSTSIATIVKTGYHRTVSEMRRKHNASQTAAGANIRVSIGQWHVGATAIINHYDKPLRPYTPDKSLYYLYKMHQASGQDFWNVSIDYGYKLGKRLHLEGETATGDCREVATVNTLSWLAGKKISLMLIQRYYPYKFYSTMGRSFSDGGNNQDESGLYVGAIWNPYSRLSLTAYSDIAYFAWPKYQALGSSHSFDNFLQLTYQTSSHSSLTARYRLRCRQRDSGDVGTLIYRNEHRLRTSYSLRTGGMMWKSQAEIVHCKDRKGHWGWMLSGNATYRMGSMSVSIGGGYFKTDGYKANIRTYEQSTPYSIAFPTFYGEGIRLYALAKAEIAASLTAEMKGGMTHYLDRDKIGSSTQQINAPSQTDIDVMLKWNF